MSVFQNNGFDFEENAETGKLMLKAVPFSKGVTFGVEDVLELIGLIEERGHGGMKQKEGKESLLSGLHPSRVKAMIASRACRKSIMIGKALTRRTMEEVVKKMAGLQTPWNCAHGRPTMRHLAVLPAKENC